MKTVYLIGGTMGVGKTAVCQAMKRELRGSVFLDGDWCWDANPFLVTDETRRMVMDNICFLLNSFIRCSAYETVLFGWVMHRQEIIDEITARLDTARCRVLAASLLCGEAALRARLRQDVDRGLRAADVIERSVARLPLYPPLETIKIDTTGKSVQAVARELIALGAED